MGNKRRISILCGAALAVCMIGMPVAATQTETKENTVSMEALESEAASEEESEPVTENTVEAETEQQESTEHMTAPEMLPETEVEGIAESEPYTETYISPETEIETSALEENEAESERKPETEFETESSDFGEKESETELKEQETDIEDQEESGSEADETEWETETSVPGESESETSSELFSMGESEPESEEKETETEAQTSDPEEKEAESEKNQLNPEATELETEIESDILTETEIITETGTETGTLTLQESELHTEESASDQIETKESEMDTDPLENKRAPNVDCQSIYWDKSWYLPEDFRFTQVDKDYALVECRGPVSYVYEETSVHAKRVGEIPYFGIAYVLKDPQEGWSYIESGNLRGFICTEELQTGIFAEEVVREVTESAFPVGKPYVEPSENAAFTYTRTTVQEVIASKQYGIILKESGILEYASPDARSVGTVSSGNLVYLLARSKNGWYFVESGDVRGFIDPGFVLTGKSADSFIEAVGENHIALAEELITPKENRSCYYTLTSVKAAGSSLGTEIAEYALSFVGNLPYVYGGTSLSSGADCSGFTQSVFAKFGVDIPRTAQSQGANGQEIKSLEEAKAGDIVYYASGPHVGIYLGDGMVVQCSGRSGNTASNPGKGPTVSPVNYMPVTSIRRYLIDPMTEGGSGRIDLTEYTDEQMQLIWAIVAQEDNSSYEGALAVISSAMNRTESSVWGGCGSNALSQLTAAGQYCYSNDSYWMTRLGGNVPSYVKQAVYDCLKRGIRNHGFTCFRSRKGNVTGSDAVQIGGNWYFGT